MIENLAPSPAIAETDIAQPPPLSDQELNLRAQAGDSDAMAELFLRHKPAVRAAAGRFAAGNSVEDVEDAAQKTFLRAFRAIQSAKPPSFEDQEDGAAGWLHRIALNLGRDAATSAHARRETTTLDGDVDNVSAVLAGRLLTRQSLHAPPLDVQVTEELHSKTVVANLLTQIPELFRGAFEDSVIHELPYKEIAEKQGVTTGTVKSRIHRAKAILKVYLAQNPGLTA